MSKHILRNIFVGAVMALILLMAGLYLFMTVAGKSLIVTGIAKATGRPTSMGSFTVTPPFTVQLNNLDVQGLFSAESIKVAPSLTSVLYLKPVISSVVVNKPSIVYERTAAVKRPPAQTTPSEPGRTKPKKKSMPVVIWKLVVKDGTLRFIDQTAAGIVIEANNVDVNVKNKYSMPASIITDFSASADIPWGQGGKTGKFEASGWVNLIKKDINARIEIKNIDGIYLYPYYADYVSLEKAKVQGATLNLRSDITGENDDVVLKNHIEIFNIQRQAPQEGASDAERIVGYVFDAFNMLGAKMEFNYTVRTKLSKVLPNI